MPDRPQPFAQATSPSAPRSRRTSSECAYFNTLGRGKVGFTMVGKDAQGQPIYVSDLRGGLERNTMRYYASIESYLDALAAPPQQQLERRLRHWYAYTERYPLQLQEEPGYLEVKRKEAQRTQSQD